MKSFLALTALAAAADVQPDDCKTNELRCRAAVVRIPVCYAVKTNVVTDKNKEAEFDRHEQEYDSRLKTQLETHKHKYSSEFTVTKIEAKHPDDVNNFVIDQQTAKGRLFFEVETTEAIMKICGDAEIRLQEIFKEDILADQFWLDEANAAVEAVANYDSSEADSTTLHFYYINNPVDCFDKNGGCSHSCEKSQCVCPPCWTIDLEGKTCHPNKGTIRTTCQSNAMQIELDECVVSGYSMETASFEAGSCAAAETASGSGIWTITTGLDDCGTTKEFKDGGVNYSNVLSIPPERTADMIFFKRPMKFTFTCEYEMSATVESSFTIKAAKRRTEFNVQQGAFDFGINFFTAANFKTVEPTQSGVVGQPVYYNVAMNSGKFLDGVEFRVTDCTVSKQKDDQINYQIWDMNGTCQPSDSPIGFTQVQKWFQGNNQQQFKFKGFKFPGAGLQEQKLGCNIQVCDMTKKDTICDQGCYKDD